MANEARVIRLRANTTFFLGVRDQIAFSPVELKQTGDGQTTIWDIEWHNNAVLLRSSQGWLALDFQGQRAASEVPLIVSPYNGAPTPTQRWSFFVRPGYITSLANPSLVVDVKDRGIKDGQPVWGYTFNSSPAQQWVLSSPFEVLAEALEEAETA
ncbi:RICIN domain-containing protein [Ralstonia sp. A12]|uniref:RICIN domain-containing protein n=1 Tax=Ralstonia sp. A12 TaxID=1217052 RepID=UPI000694C277|nr:RICIN domain-containing protein [Ralstonia sp. A12]